MGANITVELTSADPAALLRTLAQKGIVLWDVGEIKDLTLRITLQRKHLKRLNDQCRAAGAKVRILRSVGFHRMRRQMVRRPVLMAGCLLMLVLTLYLPNRILFIEVEGTGSVPMQRVLVNAEQCGIRLGAKRSEIRSEKVKNALLESMPELQWVGINTYGCRAVISVRQRTRTQQEDRTLGISSLVAIQDGVVREMTVLRGTAVCKIGQSVTKGQVLISGYSDLGICLRGDQAQGEVFAQTQRTLTSVAPSERVLRIHSVGADKKISLIFGKNRINFFKGSGISDTTCVKIYEYHYLTLPGGFQLPIALVVEQQIRYASDTTAMDRTEASELLSETAGRYVQRQMVAGRIDQRYEIVTALDDAFYQVGKYACYEMIGAVRPEEDLGNHEINGTNGERGAS